MVKSWKRRVHWIRT